MEDGQWVYLNAADQPVTDSWKESKGFWYRLDSAGYITKDTLINVGSSYYYLDPDGRMAAEAWAYLTADQIPDGDSDSEGWYYFGADGRAYTNKSGARKQIDGQTYIFDADGKLLTGWIASDGTAVEETEDPFINATHFAGEDGALYVSKWLAYSDVMTNVTGSTAHSDVADRDYTEYDELWFYFDETGKKVVARTGGTSLKQKEIDGATYGFDENGVMLPWWSAVDSVAYPDGERADMTSNVSAKYYSGYDGGVLLKNTWFFMYPSENLSGEDFEDMEASWWYADGSGKVVRDRIRMINGRRYVFDGIGRMKVGFCLVDGRANYVANYDVDMLSHTDFIEGDIGGIEHADLYLFSPDELNDGSMQVGSDILVSLADGYYYFGFGADGKAYGNKNNNLTYTPAKKNGKYYYNGLRLDADSELGYGVVKAERDGQDYYQVVDIDGKIITGEKKLVADKQGGYFIVLKDRFVAYVNDPYPPKWVKNGVSGEGYYHYDKSNKDDHYADGIIAGYADATDLSGLPSEACINF
ncbi:MAG: cell surface protein [Lachnospiraceae bacterium]|nr:cell surface protein [Lachnospiraceae bacterium]